MNNTPSTITAQIEDFAQNIYLNQALVQNNRVEDLMDICALEQLLQLANLQGHTQPILEMGYGTGLNLRELVERHGLHIDMVEGSEALCAQARALYGERIGVFCSFFEHFTSW